MVAPSHQFAVNNFSSTLEVTSLAYAGQIHARLIISIQWVSLESISLEIRRKTMGHYSQQHCG